MTDKTEAQPEALRVAAWLINAPFKTTHGDMLVGGRELRRLHADNEAKAARIAELEAQLSARQAAPDSQAYAARRRLTEAFPQAADCFHPLYIEGFKSGHAKGRVRGERATLREVGALAEAVLVAPPPPEREPLKGDQ